MGRSTRYFQHETSAMNSSIVIHTWNMDTYIMEYASVHAVEDMLVYGHINYDLMTFLGKGINRPLYKNLDFKDN